MLLEVLDDMAEFISTIRIGQIGGSRWGSWVNAFDPQNWPLLNDITLWGALGFDEGANVEHNGRTYIFTGDVTPITWDNQTPLNSDLVAWTDDGTILRHGGHRPLGYNFHLPHDLASDANHQPDWMFCTKCARLVFAGYPPGSPNYVSVCPKGGAHDPMGNNFDLPHDLGDDAGRQSDWRYCFRCGGLFFHGYTDTKNWPGICPAGEGGHIPAGYNFFLPFVIDEDPYGLQPDPDPNTQANWRFCALCSGLFWNADSIKGVCPGASGGGLHLHPVRKGNDGRYWAFEAEGPIGRTLSLETPSGAFSFGGRVYVFAGISEAFASGQTRPGDPAYGLYLVSTDQPDQPVTYRKEFLFNPRIGVCPFDGGSHEVLGYQFVLPHDQTSSGPREANWTRCELCSGLFHSGVEPAFPRPIVSYSGGICPHGGAHVGKESNPLFSIPVGVAENALNQANWRRCGNCDGIYWDGKTNAKGVCPATGRGHQPGDQVMLLLPHDQPEDDNNQANWRRCRKCQSLFWSGTDDRGRCPAGGAHDHQGKDDFVPALQDEFILAHDVVPDSHHQSNWRFCSKCRSMFFDTGTSPVRACAGGPGGHNVQGFMFVLPHGLPGDLWHQDNWARCGKCEVIFRGSLAIRLDGGPTFVGTGVCAADNTAHQPVGSIFALPHRIPASYQERNWRFCTKCFGLVSIEQAQKFWGSAAVVVRHAEHPYLPPSEQEYSLVIFGFGWGDFYLAWMPLGSEGPKLQSTLYYTGKGYLPWDRDVANAVSIGNAPGTYTSLSAAWFKSLGRWIILYSQATDAEDVDGFRRPALARLGALPWQLSEEVVIFDPQRENAWGAYMHQPGLDDINPSVPPAEPPGVDHPGWAYGVYLLTKYTEWAPGTRELGIYYLLSLSSPYQVQLMYTRMRISALRPPGEEFGSDAADTRVASG
jgi:hypothetical protein